MKLYQISMCNETGKQLLFPVCIVFINTQLLLTSYENIDCVLLCCDADPGEVVPAQVGG